MKNHSIIFLLAVLAVASITSVSSFNNAYAHTHEVVGDYTLEVGWGVEPPIVGVDNTITVMITPATEADKANSDSEMGDMTQTDANMAGDMHAEEETAPTNGISGLASTLDVTITLNGKKSALTMVEDAETAGLYIGKLTPAAAGSPTVHVFAVIDTIPVEATFHPEEIKDGALIKATSSDASINVDLLATAPSKDDSMDVNIKFTDSEGNLIQHVNYDIIATQDGTQILGEKGAHTHTGQDAHSTEAMTSSDPVDFQVKILGIGLPDDQVNWTGPKDDVIPIHVTPEFGSVAMIILGVAILSIVGFGAKSRLIPKI